MGMITQTQRFLGESPERKKQMQRRSCVLGDNIKMNVAEIRREEWIWTRGVLFYARE